MRGKFTLPLFKSPLISCVMIALLVVAAGAEVHQWQIGSDGLSWKDQQLSSTAISFENPGAIELVGFNQYDNIVQKLDWTEGTPLNYTDELSKARIWDNVPFKQSNMPLVDGNISTSNKNRFKEFGVLQAGRAFFLDLGTRFPINRIVFSPRQDGADSKGRPFSEDFIRGYKLQINDGVQFSNINLPIYSLLTQVDYTTESIAETRFPLQFVRYIQLNVTSSNPFEIAEFEVYGAGFPPGGKYLSKVIDLGEVANFSRLTWAVEKLRQVGDEYIVEPTANSRVAVRMRTGRDETPQVFFEITNVFTGDRTEVSESAYNKLQKNVRGPIEEDQDNWSEWSFPFTESGQLIQLPSPRRYCQLEVILEGEILDGIRLNSLVVEHSIPPLAQQLVGEISVLDDPYPLGNKPRVTAGTYSTFAYDISADMKETDVGFDAIKIFTPAQAKFVDFLVGNPAVSVAPDSILEGADHLTLFFPSQRISAESVGTLRFIFETQVFVQATLFNAEVFDTQSIELPQRILPGDANPDVFSNNLRVLTTAKSAQDLMPFFAIPQVLTPNGDGVNDQGLISYTLLQFSKPVDTQVEIFDLGGRKVRTLFTGAKGAGAYTLLWDGRHDSGVMLPVGIYLVKLSVDAAKERFSRLGTTSIVY